MRTIWKYPLSGERLQVLEMNEGAKILDIDHQSNQFCLWALIDTSKAKELRRFHLYGTGWEMNEYDQFTTLEEKYIGTIHTVHGYVWHFFEFVQK